MHPEEDIQEGFAFAIPDLYKTSSLADFEGTLPVIEELQPLSLLEEPRLELSVSGDLKSGLLDIPTFEYGPVEDVGVLEDSSIASLETFDSPGVVEERDVWTSLQSDENDIKSANVKSWEEFYGGPSHLAPQNLFLSEGGAQVYDAALIKSVEETDDGSPDSTAGHVIESQAILSSLILLALGRESIIYHYSEDEGSFQPRKSHVRMSGYSLQTYESFSAHLQSQGNHFRDLQDFILKTQRSTRACRVHFALAGAFVPILGALESQVACPPKQICSLLQLQELTERPGQILRCLHEVVSKIEGCKTDEDLLSKLFELVQTYEHSQMWMLQIMQELLSSASRPWLDTVENWLGLGYQNHLGLPNAFPAFTMAGKTAASGDVGYSNDIDDFKFDPSSVPTFMSTEDAETIFETGKSLRLLEAHQLDRPWTRKSRLAGDESVKLELFFTWGDIERVMAKADKYESSMRKALNDPSATAPGVDQTCLPKLQQSFNLEPQNSKLSPEALIESSKSLFERALPDTSTLEPAYSKSLLVEHSSIFAPPTSLLSTLCFKPITSACARIINHASLRLLLKTHDLRTHLSLLHRYVLMSDGVFTSRLSSALFSPHLSTTEWRQGHNRFSPSGLRLGHREAWPPASSELRLALTGIIADSYMSSGNSQAEHSMYSASLPGDISFAIRSMSSDELQKSSDPNTLFALDFLRIQYTPPAPLDSVITSDSLEKYDSVFKLLLRCLRMLYVVTHLNAPPRRSSRKHESHTTFRNESRHFVSTICTHFFNNIASHYHHLDRTLATLESTINTNPSPTTQPPAKAAPRPAEEPTHPITSIPALQHFHTHLLDSLLLACLLRKRQEQVMGLLEEIWALVLRFAYLVTTVSSIDSIAGSAYDADDVDEGVDAEIRQLHGQFRRKARVFVEVCRGLAGGAGRMAPKQEGEMGGVGVGMEVLVVMFDMNGFYMRA